MESPLDILSRAAGMVSSSNSPTAIVPPPALAPTATPTDMRLMKRKFEEPLPSEAGPGRILKKALVHQAMLDTHHAAPAHPGLALAHEDDQPLDMSCKKKRSLSPDEALHRRPIHPSERTNSNSSGSLSNSSSHLHNRPPPAPLVMDHGGYYGNGVPHKKKWSSRNNGVEPPINPPGPNSKLFLEGNNSTSDGSGTDHARRPSVIYYATQAPDVPPPHPGSGSGGGSGGGGGKFRRRFRHPSNSSTSTDSDPASAPLIRRKLVKRKRKRTAVLLPGQPERPLIEREVGESGAKSRRVVVITSKEDDIDEHFRRSLGDRYDEAKCFLNTTTNSSSQKNNGKAPKPSSGPLAVPPPAPPPVPHVVDKVPVISKDDNQKKDSAFDDQPLSVDDHFAKALGTETWSRIISTSNKPTTTSKRQSPPPPYEPKALAVSEGTAENGKGTPPPPPDGEGQKS